MIASIERLVRALGRAGASAAVDVLPVADQAGIESLTEAWYRERGRQIEGSLLLRGLRRLLSRAITQGRLTDQDARGAAPPPDDRDVRGGNLRRGRL
jgi:hypothetical protein